MSTKLSKVWGHAPRRKVQKVEYAFPLPEQYMGVEVELDIYQNEGARFANAKSISPFWETKSDGSLRDGEEYVLVRPLKGNDLATAVRLLMCDSGGVFQRSSRGSTHIHLDMMEDETTTDTLQVIVALAYIFEDCIFKMADPAREWCGYANKLATAPDTLLEALSCDTLADNTDVLLLASSDASIGRYYGLNIQALRKYGSLEFRYFPTAESEDELLNWINLVQTFKVAALHVGKLSAMHDVLRTDDTFNDFVQKFFGRWYDSFANVSRAQAMLMFERMSNAYPVGVASRQFATTRFTAKALKGERFKRLLSINIDELPSITGKYHIIVTPQGQNATPATSVDGGTILVHSEALYIALNGRWEYLSGNSLTYDLFRRNGLEWDTEALQQAIEQAIEASDMSSSVKDYCLRSIRNVILRADAYAPRVALPSPVVAEENSGTISASSLFGDDYDASFTEDAEDV